jgi:hypothetical protein
MKPYLSTISAPQTRAIGQLGPFARERGIYLAGGTAVALHLGHRQSVDLDWFGQDIIDDPLKLAHEIQARGISFNTVSADVGTLHGIVDSVQVSLLNYPYTPLEPIIECDSLSCDLAAILDLATMKLAAVEHRGSKKDFIDVYAIAAEQVPLLTMIAAYQRRYCVSDTGRLLCSLTYFDDAEADPMPAMRWSVAWEEVKAAIREWVKALAP